MALMMGDLYAALRAVNVAEDKARQVAEEVAGYETRLSSLETRLAVLMVMVGGLYAIALPAAWLLIRIALKIGAM